jgi:hypothetical protein
VSWIAKRWSKLLLYIQEGVKLTVRQDGLACHQAVSNKMSDERCLNHMRKIHLATIYITTSSIKSLHSIIATYNTSSNLSLYYRAPDRGQLINDVIKKQIQPVSKIYSIRILSRNISHAREVKHITNLLVVNLIFRL